MLDNHKFQTGEDYYHRLNFIFNLLIAIPLVPFGFLYLAQVKNRLSLITLESSVEHAISIAVLLTTAFITFKAISQYNSKKRTLWSEDGLRKKMILFHQILILKYMLFSITGAILTLGFLLTLHKIHVVAFIVILVLLSLRRPTLRLIVEELNLPPEEAEILRKKEVIPL